MTADASILDLVEELQLRRWARENYVPAEDRDPAWHVVVCDEMARRDSELVAASPCRRKDIVPLAPQDALGDRPHTLRGPLAPAGGHHASELHYT
jgi:hypothetical protein